MAQRIVDVLETIEIHEQQREHFAGAVCLQQHGVQAIVEQQPVWQARQCIQQAGGPGLHLGFAQFQRGGEMRCADFQRVPRQLRIERRRFARSAQQYAQHVAMAIAQRQRDVAGKTKRAQVGIVVGELLRLAQRHHRFAAHRKLHSRLRQRIGNLARRRQAITTRDHLQQPRLLTGAA